LSAEELEEIIKRNSLVNAVAHGGKCNPQAVLGRVLAERPSLKENVKAVIRLVNDVSKKVNQMSLEEQEKVVSKYKILKETVRLQQKEKGLPPLPEADRYKQIVTRFAPNPDSVLHLGSARAIILSHDYARLCAGKFILRFEDTDPRLKKAALQFYKSIKDDLKWLECMWDEEYIQSDRLPTYYDYARRLIEVGGAYVCTCKVDSFRRRLIKKKPCLCRSLSPKEHIERFNKMLDGTYKEGKAVLRIKTDMNHPNPAVRDWPALRIIDTKKHPHPRVGAKFRVWPLYNLASGLDDHLMGITHIIRGKEHYTNMVRQRYMYDHLGWVYPTAIHYGRLKIEGGVLSKSKIIQGIANGLYTGFDDPRLATFQALRKRGILPKTIRTIIYEVGIRPIDATISWATLYSINKKIIDKSSPRYFVVINPIVLSVKGLAGRKEIALKKHPEFESMGYRKIVLNPAEDGILKVYIKKDDLKKIQAHSLFRLMGFANVYNLKTLGGHLDGFIHSYGMDTARRVNAPLIHWVPVDSNVRVRLIDQNGQVLEGFGEKGLFDEPVNTIVQLEREGFARIDSKEKSVVTLYFSSK